MIDSHFRRFASAKISIIPQSTIYKPQLFLL